MENNGKIDLSRHVEITADEGDVLSVLLLSMNRKKYPMKLLVLDNCELTDDKMEKLAPLLTKFDKVSLNGAQKITSEGWDCLAEAIKLPGNRLRKIELKITKTDENTIKVRRDILLEEFIGTTLTAECLKKIGKFLPFLEKVYLDDVFNDKKHFEEVLYDAWKVLAKQILTTPTSDLKLRYILQFKCNGFDKYTYIDSYSLLPCFCRFLSLPGCAINDDIIAFLAPALVRIKVVHLGKNLITPRGWGLFKEALDDQHSTITHLSLRLSTHDKKFSINASVMEKLTPVILQIKEVDLSGQQEIGVEGWTIFMEQCLISISAERKLESLKLANCKIKDDVKDQLERTLTFVKFDFGSFDSLDDSDGKTGSRRKCFKSCLCAS